MYLRWLSSKSGAVMVLDPFPSFVGIFLPELTFNADSLMVFEHPCVQLSALTFVWELKISSNGSHTTVLTHKNTAHTRSTHQDRIFVPKWQGH